MATLEWSDYLAIVLYFVIVLGVGFWATFRKAKTDNAVGYFLAGRSMPWILVGASTFSTNIGAPMFVGIAGTAAASGIAVVMFEWHVGVAIIFTTLAMWMLILLGWLFLPVYMACGCYTMPQYLKMRYGGQRIRIWLAILHIFLTIVAQIAGQMYAGALFIQQIFEWDLYLSVALILAVTVVYTVIGGLTAVIWTDTIQTVILILGSTLLGIITMIDIGGFESMRNQYMQAAANYTFKDEGLYKNHTCGMPRDDAFHIFRDIDSDYPWPGLVGGLTILALNAWCTDQLCVQRSLSAKSVSHARAGLLLAAYLKILPFFFFLMPGMISRIYYPEEVACADPDACRRICENPSGCFDIAYPLLVTRVLPDGVRGIMLAALLAALMSSMTSMFNSSSTVFTMDIWRRLRPHAEESELMVVGRVYTIFLVGVAIAWLPILEEIKGSQFWNYSQSIASFILPPIVVTFLMGIFWTRTTEKGAFAGLVVGLIGGLIRMGLEWSIDPPHCGSGEENKQFEVVSAVHYLHFAIILAVVVFVVQFLVSLMTKPRPPKKLRRVTYWTRNTPELPELTESEDEPEEEKQESDAEYEIPSDLSGKFKHYFLRWVCGVEKGAKPPKLSKEERIRLQLKATSIKQDPFWKKVLDINAIICASVAVFIHAFWA